MVSLCAVLALVGLGCGGKSDTPPTGSERGPCFINGACDIGLTCLSKVCVQLVDAGGDANPGTGMAGSGGGTGGGGRGGIGGVSGSSGAAGTYAAAHPPQPQVANLGGPVLTAPKLRPIFFTGDPDEAAMKSFLTEVATGSYWAATTSEYGIGALTVLPAVSAGTASIGTVSDDALQSTLMLNTASAAAAWGAADPSTIYAFILPASVSLTFSTEACCTSFGGYHYETFVNGVAVPYIAACACPDFLGPGWNPVDERTAALSHELIEAAADPFPLSDPAYQGANQSSLIWSVLTGGELTDMCTVQPDAYFRPAGATRMVSRSWSNAAAKAGDDPCVPAPSSTIPYFNSMPVLDTIPYGDTGYWTQGLQIPIGTSRTIDLDLFSTAALPHDWDVAVYPYEDFYGGTRSINVSMNKASGKNGDIIRLTISALRQNPTFGMSPFIIISSYGSPSDTDYRSHVSMGLVTNY